MMARAEPKLALRPYLPADAAVLAEIFRASIAELTGDDYSAAQQEAWAAAADDEAAFAARLAEAVTLLGTIDGSPVGFASLAGGEQRAFEHATATAYEPRASAPLLTALAASSTFEALEAELERAGLR